MKQDRISVQPKSWTINRWKDFFPFGLYDNYLFVIIHIIQLTIVRDNGEVPVKERRANFLCYQQVFLIRGEIGMDFSAAAFRNLPQITAIRIHHVYMVAHHQGKLCALLVYP